MKKLLSAMMMAMFLVSVTGVAFADEKAGEHKDMKKEEKKEDKKAEKKEKKK
jgi:ribosomal protein L12E/L44/L45/RPP1/RPP2